MAHLANHSSWAVDHLPQLIRFEKDGLSAAQGESLVHFDLSPHNILLTPERVIFVDWPGARLGAPVIDLIMILSSAADRVDRDSILESHYPPTKIAPKTIDGILAAHAGCLVRGGVSPKPPGLEPIATIELRLGLSALTWLQQRLTNRA